MNMAIPGTKDYNFQVPKASKFSFRRFAMCKLGCMTNEMVPPMVLPSILGSCQLTYAEKSATPALCEVATSIFVPAVLSVTDSRRKYLSSFKVPFQEMLDIRRVTWQCGRDTTRHPKKHANFQFIPTGAMNV